MNETNGTGPVKQEKKRLGALNILGIVLCVIMVPILIVNCTMLIKSAVNKDEVASVFSISPMIVLSDSMHPIIKSGDVIIIRQVEPGDVKEGDIISFFDPDSSGSSVVTHRVIEIHEDANGKRTFRTAGDANNKYDKATGELLEYTFDTPLPEENVIGVYLFRIALAGNVAMFMQSTWGMIICIGVPLVLFVGLELLRRRKHEKKRNDETAQLLAELEALKKAQAERNAQETPEVTPEIPETPPDPPDTTTETAPEETTPPQDENT